MANREESVDAEQEALILDGIERFLDRDRPPPCRRARARRHLPRGHRREDEGDGALRGHHRRGIRRPRPAGHHLCQGHRAALPRLDVGERPHQFAPHHGGCRGALRHGRAARVLPAPLRQRRAARRARADRAGLRHRPAGDPHHGAARGQQRLRDQRRQDLDHQQHPRLVPGAAGQDRPRRRAAPQGHEPVPRREGRGLPRQPQAAEARLSRDRQPPSSPSRTTGWTPTS